MSGWGRVGLRITCACGLFAALSGSPAFAQAPREPVGPFAADVRVALPRFKDDSAIATGIGVSTDNLPGRGLGLAGGINVYPVRRKVTLGVGAEVLISRASKTLEPEQEDGAPGPTVNTRFSVLSPQVSLNFGSNRGWSYISGGLGWGRFTTEREDDPVGDPTGRPRVFNYGGGARWFAKDHLAFTLDLRFYTVDAQEATIDRPPYPKMRLMVFSAGVGFK